MKGLSERRAANNMPSDQLLIQIVINELLRMKDQQNNMRDVRALHGAITLIKTFRIVHGEMEKGGKL